MILLVCLFVWGFFEIHLLSKHCVKAAGYEADFNAFFSLQVKVKL